MTKITHYTKIMDREGLFWRQTASGRWERDIDEVEQFYTTFARRFAGTGRKAFAMTAHISLNIFREDEMMEPRVIDALQKAWLCMRYDHPTIASWVEHNPTARRCRKVYQEFPKVGFENHQVAWLRETFQFVTKTQSGEEWCNSDPPVPKLPTLFMIKRRAAPDNALIFDLVLRSQHDIIDGIGSLQLMGNLILCAARILSELHAFVAPNFGDEWQRLSPPLRLAAGIPDHLTPDKEARFKKIIEQNTMLRREAEISTIPFRCGRSMPGRHQRVAFTVPLDVSSRILQACRAINASMTHVYHASIAMVMRDMQERRSQARKVRYISYSLINERGHCKEPFSTTRHAVAVYHSVSGQSMAIDLDVPDTAAEPRSDAETRDEMLRVVDQVKSYYMNIRNDHQHLSMAPSYWKLSTRNYPLGKEDFPIPEPNPTPSASISSLGVIDNLIPSHEGPFEVDDPWVVGEELGTGLGLFLGTFRGRVCLSAVYNDAWHDKMEVMEFMEKCHMSVLKCLRV